MNALRRATAASPLRAVAAGALVAGASFLLLPLPLVIRGAIGLPLVLLAPGWLAVAAMFPGRAFDPVLRGVIAVGLSIAIAILTGILLAGLHIRLGETAFTTMAALEVAVAALAADRNGGALWLPRLRWTMTTVLLAVAVEISILAFAIARQTPTARSDAIKPYTALWSARDSGAGFRVGVISGELKRTRFELEVLSRRDRLRRVNLTLRPGQAWEAKFHVASRAGLRVELRRAGEARLYREIDVSR
jgi:Protein of unknown function (DUF1616)